MGPPWSDAKSVRLPSSKGLGAASVAVLPTISAGTGLCVNGSMGSNGNLLADVIDFEDRIAST